MRSTFKLRVHDRSGADRRLRIWGWESRGLGVLGLKVWGWRVSGLADFGFQDLGLLGLNVWGRTIRA